MNLFHIFILIISYDIWFYITHIIFHYNSLYKYHKKHHEDKNTTYLVAFKGGKLEQISSYGSIFIYIIFSNYIDFTSLCYSSAYTTIRSIIQHEPRLLNNKIISIFYSDHHIKHHTFFNYNYGQYWLDYLFGTLKK
jgi:sterol desaturase/sphingolipid hydroxylase (fatty acid hydroxylase superfamily)